MKYLTFLFLFVSLAHAEEIHWPATISDMPDSKLRLATTLIEPMPNGSCSVFAILQECKSKKLLAYEKYMKDPKTIALMKKNEAASKAQFAQRKLAANKSKLASSAVVVKHRS